MKISLKDKNFRGDSYSSRSGKGSVIEWDRSCSQKGPVVYTDTVLMKEALSDSKEKIAWLLEPRVINSRTYEWIKKYYQRFLEVWTHDQYLLDTIPNSKWVPMAGTWIEPVDRGLHEKTKLCSFFASAKNKAPGHKLRHRIRSILPDFVDQYGKGVSNPIPKKSNGLKEYAFSIAIENCQQPVYFTEKLIDCFLTGTIPIYWGTQTVNQYFNTEGIVHFNSLEQLQQILAGLSFNIYEEKKEAVKENFKIAKEFEIGEEWALKNQYLQIQK